MTSEMVLEDQIVLITSGQISALGSANEVRLPEGTDVVDGRGQFLIPGLSDMHAHLRRAEGHRPEDYLAQGVTVVRNMQGVPSHVAFRDQVRAGRIPGPIVFTAGPAIAGRRIDRRHKVPESESEARALVREHSAAGYDYIKVYSLLSSEMYDAILDEAQQVGIPVVGHVPDAVRASHAIRAGQSSLEHMFGYFWELEAETSGIRGQWDPRRLFHAVEIDDARLSVLAERTARARVWNCPTLWRKSNYLTSPLAEDAWNTPELRALGEENRRRLLKALSAAGAGLLTGTDDRAEIIHEELELFVDAGLTPFDALHASTYAAAEYLGALNRFGTVEVGKDANLVLLRANPLDDIANTSAISGVMMRGVWMPAEH
jgi:imidazolonepropionase-like amidohydrolase